MRRFNRFSRFAMLVVCGMLLGSVMAQAAWYNPLSWGKKKRVTYDYLIITGNFVRSRMLAELMQYQSKYPVLLLPTGEEKDSMYALGPDGKAIVVHRDRYVEFVRMIQPKQVIFLGNESYVPSEFVQEIDGRFPTVVFRHDDWETISKQVGDMLKMDYLHPEYRRLLRRLDGKGDPLPGDNPGAVWKSQDATVPAATDDSAK